MKTANNIRLTSMEMASLWNGYMLVSLVHHVFQCFLRHVDDQDIKSCIEFCDLFAKDHAHKFISVFKKENFPIPQGITSEDIKPDAPRLFSDIIYINYIKNMARFALMSYSMSYTVATRDDIRQLFNELIEDLVIIDQKCTDIMISKGIYVRPPYIPTPQEVGFVKKQNFLTGFFGNKRPLTVIEITQLFLNAQSNALGKAVVMGFSQVAQSKELQQYFVRGKEIAHKHVKVFSDILTEEDLPAPSSNDGEVMESTESPFSDKLMLFHINLLISSSLGNYGMAMASSQRRDLSAMYARLIVEGAAYGEDGANLLIENGWMEQPPTAPDRDTLAKV